MVFNRRSIGIFYAMRVCNGRGGLYPRKKRGKYHYEKSDGLLHWLCSICHARFGFDTCRRLCCRCYRFTEFRNFYALGYLQPVRLCVQFGVLCHGGNGIWGTIAVGLFSTDSGLFYGGGFRQLGVQALGVVSILAYTTVMMLITFSLIKKFHGLRVSPEEEISGLDSVEHGLASAYAGFEFSLDPTLAEYTVPTAASSFPVDVAVPVTDVSSAKSAPAGGKKITKVEIICKESRFEALKATMDAVGITGMTVTKVLGCGVQKGKTSYYRGVKIESMDLNPKVQVDIVVSAVPVYTLVEAAKKALYTGNIGDGKIFVYGVENVIKVRTGEEGFDALQGDEQF